MSEPFAEGTVRGFLHSAAGASRGSVALGHGAGSNARAPVLVTVAAALAEAGFTVLRFDLPFRQARPSGPPWPAGAPADQEGIRAAAGVLRRIFGGRVFLGGHSYGGRQSTMLAAAGRGGRPAAAVLPIASPETSAAVADGAFSPNRHSGCFPAWLEGPVWNARRNARGAGADSRAGGAHRGQGRRSRFEERHSSGIGCTGSIGSLEHGDGGGSAVPPTLSHGRESRNRRLPGPSQER